MTESSAPAPAAPATKSRHDWNNLIGMVLMNLEVAAGEKYPIEMARKAARNALEAARKIHRLGAPASPASPAPAARTPAATTDEPPPGPPPATAEFSESAPPCVLLVDDEASNRDVFRRALEAARMKVATAASAVEGTARLAEADFDVAVVDISMPDVDGIEFARRLRAGRRNARIPVLFLTGLDDIRTIERAFSAGGEDYIRKPVQLREIQARVGYAAHRYRLVRDLDDAEAILMSLARSVEAKDETTGSHCDRLAHMAVVLGRALGLDDADLVALRRGGVLHDIGKIGIPDSILLKPGPLTEEERETMKTHVRIGASLLAPLRTMERTLPIVLHHHEHWNGTGYPDGLRGDRIPLLARVFQVCDTYDALTSERPYKRPLAPAEAVEVQRQEAAKGYWDPEILEVFARIVRDEPASLLLP